MVNSEDKAYIEFVNNRWEAYTYSDGDRVCITRRYTRQELVSYLEKRGYTFLDINTFGKVTERGNR